MKYRGFVFAVLMMLLFSVNLSAQDVMDIVAKTDEVQNPPNLQGEFSMTLISANGNERKHEVTAYQKKAGSNQENRLFLFTYPASVKGTALLVNSFSDGTEDVMWLYLPAVDKLKRVNLSSSGGGYFMGSDFTFSDLITRDRSEFNYTLTGEEEYNGDLCYVIEVRGKSRDIDEKYGYSLQRIYTRKSDYVNVRVFFYDLAGDLLKELMVKEVANFTGYAYPSHIIMKNLQSGHASVIEFTKLEAPEDIPDKYFTQRYLQNR